MAKGPKGEKRAADLSRRAFDIVRIASGEAEEPEPRSPAAELGSKGGKARAESLTKTRRSEIARRAAAKRWERR